jgi:putative hemolysin
VFGLGDRRVVELMQPRMNLVWLDVQDSAERVRARISGSTYSRFPVGNGSMDKVLGYVHVKDILDCCVGGLPIDIRSCLRPLPAVPETIRALKVLEVFKKSRTHIALVVNEHGGVEGLITMHDILEAVVGDLPAPGENTDAHAIRREDGSWLVDGITPIFEFKELLDVRDLPGEEEEGFATIGGFVVSQLGHIPVAGERFEAGGKRYEVVDMDGNRVDKILVSDVTAVLKERPVRGSE